MTNPSDASFRERLWPSAWLMIALLLILPAVMLMITPINAAMAVPIAIIVYVIIAGSLMLMAPTVQVENGQLTAGGARIPVQFVGEVQYLDDDALRRTIGPGADARAHLLVRGYIHDAVRIEITDPADPTPYWVVTTRKPKSLAAAITAAKAG